MPSEARCFRLRRWRTGDIQPLGEGVELMVSGIGPRRAAAAALTLIERGAKGLVSFGVAGGLTASLRPGDLVLSDVVTGETGERWATAVTWRDALERRLGELSVVSHGMVAESRQVVATPSDKRALHAQTGAAIVDMESASILRVAAQHDLRGIIVRAVADDATVALPSAVRRAFDSQGNLRPCRCVMSALQNPRIVPDLLRVARGFSRATRTLRAVVATVGPRLSFEIL